MKNEKNISEQPAIVQNEPKTAENVKENAPKKFRIGWFILSIVPIVATFVLQSLAMIPLLTLASFDIIDSGAYNGDSVDFANQIMSIYFEKYSAYGFVLYAIVALIVFSIWYLKAFAKKSPKVSIKEVFGVKSVAASVVSVLALQFIIYAAMTGIAALFPNAFDSYNSLMEGSGIGSNVLTTIVYGIFLAPVVEELCLRGLTYSYLKKAGLKPWAVIIISAFFFGLMHLNLVQGVYTFFFGLVLAYLRYKYDSIKITILAHFCFNLFGSYGMDIFEKLGFTSIVFYILGAVSVAVVIFCFILVKGDKKANKGLIAA